MDEVTLVYFDRISACRNSCIGVNTAKKKLITQSSTQHQRKLLIFFRNKNGMESKKKYLFISVGSVRVQTDALELT